MLCIILENLLCLGKESHDNPGLLKVPLISTTNVSLYLLERDGGEAGSICRLQEKQLRNGNKLLYQNIALLFSRVQSQWLSSPTWDTSYAAG